MLYARAGERVYGTKTITTGRGQTKVVDYHHATVRHDIFLGQLPDFPACLGDWQQESPPLVRQFYTELTTNTAMSTKTQTFGEGVTTVVEPTIVIGTKTHWVELNQHGGGTAPKYGVPHTGESWWRPWTRDDEVNNQVDYDLRFKGQNGTCTWGMDRLTGTSTGATP